MSRPFRVCLVLEGSYPFVTGGVSAWVHELILGLPEVDFVLYTISPEPDLPRRYPLPANVRDHVDLLLNSPPEPSAGRPGAQALAESVLKSHSGAFSGAVMDLTSMIRQVPEGFALQTVALSRDDYWRMVVDRNGSQNPNYPFSDYLWSWKGSHELIFRVLQAAPPEADLYHALSTGFAGLAALAAKVRRGKPALLSEHGLYHREREMEIRKATFLKGYQRDLWTRIYEQISQVCYRDSDLVTALFEANRQEQIRLGAPPERTRVVPNGIDVSRFAGVVRRPRPGFHVGQVGRVVPIKDTKTFILTAKILAASLPEAQFHCIGPTDEDPAYYEECLRLVESLRLGDRFFFTGRQDVLEYYGFLDVMVLTSIREAQPLAVLEAWAAGVDVVSTRVGNVPEMADYDDRFLADSKDSESLARKVLWIRHHPEEAARALAGFQQKVRSVYDKETLMGTYRTIYAGLGGDRWPASGSN